MHAIKCSSPSATFDVYYWDYDGNDDVVNWISNRDSLIMKYTRSLHFVEGLAVLILVIGKKKSLRAGENG